MSEPDFRPRLHHVAISVAPDVLDVLDVQNRADVLAFYGEVFGWTDDYALTGAYIGFLLPLMVELQHLERLRRT
jgi:hypothetical protein